MKSLLPLGMRQLIFPYSLPGSGTPKKCSWQSNVSNRGFSPAVMYHRPCAAHLSCQGNYAASLVSQADNMQAGPAWHEDTSLASKALIPQCMEQRSFADHQPQARQLSHTC